MRKSASSSFNSRGDGEIPPSKANSVSSRRPKERIGALRAGVLPLNHEDDETKFSKVGVSTYALEVSPLLERFVHPVEPVEEEE